MSVYFQKIWLILIVSVQNLMTLQKNGDLCPYIQRQSVGPESLKWKSVNDFRLRSIFVASLVFIKSSATCQSLKMSKRLKISQFPKKFVLHFKRFSQNGNSISKNSHPVKCPENFFAENGLEYLLSGIFLRNIETAFKNLQLWKSEILKS
jgi:hypothetical protein